MPLMTNPNLRQHHLGIRLRHRSLPRRRKGKHHHQPQDHDCQEIETNSLGTTKSLRRRSLPKRLKLCQPQHAEKTTFNEEPSSTTQRRKVAFREEDLEQAFESYYNQYQDFEFDATKVYYQENDYTRFLKDRILTSFDYQASVQAKSNFNHDDRSIRGLELIIHPRWQKRIIWEKKDLWKALQKEEALQKEMCKFPNFERFKVISRRHTKSANDRAILLGAEDAKDAQPEKPGSGRSWLSRKLAFGAPERAIRRHQSMD